MFAPGRPLANRLTRPSACARHQPRARSSQQPSAGLADQAAARPAGTDILTVHAGQVAVVQVT